MSISRRKFLKYSGVFGAGMGMQGVFPSFSMAQGMGSQTGEDYKALVCVFMLGGMDCHDTLIPYEQSLYNQWASIRSPMLGGYTTARTRANLLPLTGRQYALPPEMTGLHQLYGQGKAGVVSNVGPLLGHLTRAQFEAETAKLPSRLFSHNDQQSTWAGGAPEGTTQGWGGAFTDAMVKKGYNSSPEFSAITSGGLPLMVTGEHTAPFNVSDEGASRIYALEEEFDDPSLRDSINQYFKGQNQHADSMIKQDMRKRLGDAINSNEKYNSYIGGATPLTTQFPAGQLGPQLKAVTQAIQIRNQLGAGRQMFMVSMGGFDTHDRQAKKLPQLQKDLDAGILAFTQAMEELGISDKVTLFTASDFGRSLVVNGDGTDHGWGGHHFVVGGAVQGGQVWGTPPPPTLNHDWDAGNGRLIPQYSVEQMASPLGKWFGLSDTELDVALPRRGSFNNSAISIFS